MSNATLLLTATDKKTGCVVSIVNTTIYVQFFPVPGSMSVSDQISIGSFSLLQTDAGYVPMVKYDRWVSTLNATNKPEGDRDEDDEALIEEFGTVLDRLDSQVSVMVNKLLSGASFKHQVQSIKSGDKLISRYTHLSTNESFIESEAKRLTKSFNDQHPEMFMTLEDARQQISDRIDAYRTAKTAK